MIISRSIPAAANGIISFFFFYGWIIPSPSSCHLLPCVSSPSLLGTLIPIGFGAHLNPGWSHLETLNLITSAKTFFPNKVTHPGSRATTYLQWGDTIQLTAPCSEWKGLHSFRLTRSLEPCSCQPWFMSLPLCGALTMQDSHLGSCAMSAWGRDLLAAPVTSLPVVTSFLRTAPSRRRLWKKGWD